MSETSKVLQKNPPLEAAADFYRLRREGIGFIAQMGSRKWTDYNVHDPGITILEAFSYAITDLAYRLGWDIEDILTPSVPSGDPLQPYPNQAFPTAREILTVNPVTPNDFRRLLIDLDFVRNAWILCKDCACDASYFAWCDTDKLTLSYAKPANVTPAPVEVSPHGLYEALLELETDPELGDLNDRKLEYRTVFHDQNGPHPTIMELRFPDISLSNPDQWQLFLESDSEFDSGSFTVTLTRLGATRTFDLFGLPSAAERDSYIRSHWRTVFYASFSIDLIPSGKTILIENAALRLFSDTAAKNATTAKALKDLLKDKQPGGFIQRYRKKATQTLAAVKSAKAALHSHRNLDEDYCLVQTVGVEEVAVCADVEVTPDADIERVQAEVWFRIEQYLNPPILFRTLQELRDAGEPVEEIFDGPELASGFIKASDLEAASLRSVLRTSDILNSLMDIDGVVAVNQLQLTKYDAEGNAIKGAADPTWDADGNPLFDPNRLSASWLLFIASRHQPRLYLNLSRFLFYKNGLPFLPRLDEATDVLNQLRGDADRPKNPGADNDLKIPKGDFRNPDDYYPVQYSLPQTYGVGPSGLPAHASAARRAQARQLKAYLTVFEQLVDNALAQIAHTADLFSLDPAVTRTYFVNLFSEALIKGFNDIAQAGMTLAALEAISETQAEFYERRNRFLDHLLARFGEDFGEYALLLTDAAGKQVAQQRLIDDKIAFLKRYKTISHDRAKAFNYKVAPCSEINDPAIKKRITLLLGYPDLSFTWTVGTPAGGNYPLDFQLLDGTGHDWLDGSLTVAAADDAEAKQAGSRTVLGQMVREDAYDIVSDSGQFRLELKDQTLAPLGQFPQLVDSLADARAIQAELMAWSANERLIVVEHLLLRPKFPGDALYPACSDTGCCTCCGDEDPYSFRLTFVMPGWVAQYTDNLDLRRFADRTIQQETPSHLLGKTCWVGNVGFVENLCDEVVGDLSDLLIAKGLTAANVAPGVDEACTCANAIYQAFSAVFTAWYGDKTLDFIHEDALRAFIDAEFSARIASSDVSCTTVMTAPLWADVQEMMTGYFVGIALNGWQFERFEDAWCKWLDANAAIDWTEERLLARVQAVLEANLTSAASQSALCDCARTILTKYGTEFFDWMQANLSAGHAFDALTAFAPSPITLCAGMSFKPGTAAAIAQLLGERYGAYEEVSYRLRVVVNLLSRLRNVYPGATLHDCDDGSDHNPVRLDSTALGNYPLRSTLT
jgi:hypothetical protein